jgi:cell division protein FtsW
VSVTSPRSSAGTSKVTPAGATPAGRSTRTAGTTKRPPGRIGKLWRTGRKLTADWLDRPMTSLHLVLAIFALMLGFGLLMVLSSSSVAAFRSGGSSFSVFANQATYAALGLLCFWATQFVPIRVLRSTSTAAVIISLGLLVLVLVMGAKVNGARSWIRLAGFQFQPSEIAKLALLLWMAHVLAARRSTLGSPKALLIPVLPVFVLMAGLIMFQPDLGTTVALTIVFMAVLYFAGAPWWTFAGLAAIGTAGFFYLAISADYRLARLLSFIDPEAHPDTSYQLLQSLYGMGNGGWFGVGLGQSRAKWSYLPNADSDFIFAIIGEELGLIGAGILLLLFALLAYTGLRIARRNVDPFVKIVASAATVWLVGQAAINIGYVVGLLPVTGIPLPMISAGGTSLLITMVVFGLLANFARREPQAAAALQAGGGSRLARFLGMQNADGSFKTPTMRRRRRGTAPLTGDAATAGSRPAKAAKSRSTAPKPAARAGSGTARSAASAPQRTGSARRPTRPISGSTRWLPGSEPRAGRQRPGDPPRPADRGRSAGSQDPADRRRSTDPQRSAPPYRAADRQAPTARGRGAAAESRRTGDPAGRTDAARSAPRARSTGKGNPADRRAGSSPRPSSTQRDGAPRTRAPRPDAPRSGADRGDRAGRSSRWDGA